MIRQPYTKQEIINVIERKGDAKIPLVFHKWWGEGLYERYGDQLKQLEQNYPDDIFTAWYQEPGYDISSNENPSYRFGYRDDYADAERHSIGKAVVLLPDWDELDQFLADFPNPNEPHTFDDVKKYAINEKSDRYKLGCWWRLFHERLWSIRGMENLMMDYYDNMDGLKKIGKKILEFNKVIVDRFAELGFDGIFSSDDLGHQTGPMMSPEVFEELYLPLYRELISYVHSKGMHFFLHSCGDNTKLMEYLIEAGLDVFHPVQKGCMDMAKTSQKFGDRITFLAGMDVQDTLPHGTALQVRNEIKYIRDTFGKSHGGLLLAAGNGIMGDTPFENINAMLDEMSK